MTKGLWVYCPCPMFLKTFTLLYFYILSHLFSFWNNFPTPPHLPLFFPTPPPPPPPPQPHFHKSYPQSKTFLNIQAIPISAVFCSNAVFFQFFYDFFTSVSLMCYQVPLLPLE